MDMSPAERVDLKSDKPFQDAELSQPLLPSRPAQTQPEQTLSEKSSSRLTSSHEIPPWLWDAIAVALFTVASIFTHTWKIGKSNIVTWDEAQWVLMDRATANIP